MAASANPSGNQEGNHGSSINGHGNPNNSMNSSGVNGSDNLISLEALKHNPGVALDWSSEEQSILEDELNKHTSESSIVRYARIAMQLRDKTVRDVALRCRWMSKKENGKRRKHEDHNRKGRDKKEKVGDPSAKQPSHLGGRPNMPPYALPVLPMDNDDGISYKEIGGATGQMLEQNAQVFSQIQANLTSLQIHENISLFCQTRDNILTILNDLNDMPGIMKQMPPLPVKVNEELANSILPRPSTHMQQ